jgi:hypothetical protein
MGAIRRSGRLEIRNLIHIAVIGRRFFDLHMRAERAAPMSSDGIVGVYDPGEQLQVIASAPGVKRRPIWIVFDCHRINVA